MVEFETPENEPGADPHEVLSRNFKCLFPNNSWHDLNPGMLGLEGAPFVDLLIHSLRTSVIRWKCKSNQPVLYRDDPYRMNQLYLTFRLEKPLVALVQKVDLENYESILGKDESFGGTATRIYVVQGREYPVNVTGIYKNNEPKAIFFYRKGVKAPREDKSTFVMPKLVYSKS